jgi:hypothetical protein
MPVVKLEFECPEDLDKANKTEIIILAEGKKEIVLERKRNSKIVRCFNCNRFGHLLGNLLQVTKKVLQLWK